MQVDKTPITDIAVDAAEMVLPWDKVSPPYFSDWLEVFSKAHGVNKELMFMSILPTVSSLLGFSKLQTTSTYSESLALACVCLPSGGKHQCFSFGCKQPMTSVENTYGKCLLLDKFTEVGLRQHLMQNDGVALIMNEEMEDTLQYIQSERKSVATCAGCLTVIRYTTTVGIMVPSKLLNERVFQ